MCLTSSRFPLLYYPIPSLLLSIFFPSFFSFTFSSSILYVLPTLHTHQLPLSRPYSRFDSGPSLSPRIIPPSALLWIFTAVNRAGVSQGSGNLCALSPKPPVAAALRSHFIPSSARVSSVHPNSASLLRFELDRIVSYPVSGSSGVSSPLYSQLCCLFSYIFLSLFLYNCGIVEIHDRTKHSFRTPTVTTPCVLPPIVE